MTILATPNLSDMSASSKFVTDLYANDFLIERLRPATHARLAEAPAENPYVNVPAEAQLREHLARHSRALGTHESVVDRYRAGARLIVTGQQPGVYGGPLMTLYKVVTAVALADELTQSTGIPHVAMYWVGADDDDFAEIRSSQFLTSDGTPFGLNLPPSAHRVGMPVGDIAADAVLELWTGALPMLGSVCSAASRLVNEANRGAADLGDVAARTVLELTRHQCLIVDGRDSEVRRTAGALISTFIEQEQDLNDLLTAAGNDLVKKGYHAQLTSGISSGAFLLQHGLRLKVPMDDRDPLLAAANDPARISPGVLLRNLIQDTALRPSAVVLGPGEIAYRAQMEPVYRRLGIPRPCVIPRLFATYVPEFVHEFLREASVAAELVATYPQELATQGAALATDPAAVAAADRFAEQLARARDELLDGVSNLSDPQFAKKLRKRLDDVQRRGDSAVELVAELSKANALNRWPWLKHAKDVFRPRDVPQERIMAMLVPFIEHGLDATAAIKTAADHHVGAVLDGRLEHVVYSVT